MEFLNDPYGLNPLNRVSWLKIERKGTSTWRSLMSLNPLNRVSWLKMLGAGLTDDFVDASQSQSP